jgi:hypothetical protein
VVRRVHVETDDVLDLGGEGGIGGPFERAQAMGLAMGVPDALDGALKTRLLSPSPSRSNG